MNNSDYNDFQNWQNGDDNDPSNPNNGFFYYGPFNPKFKNMWNKMQNNEDYFEHMQEYLNMDDILKQWSKQLNNKPNPNKQPRNKPQRPQKTKVMTFSQDEYMKLIEIRGYLAITEQFAHVKALDKLINQIQIIPVDPKEQK
jgi:hypothetical protein